MPQPHGVFLLSIGDELLDGRTSNSNATFFGEQLRLAGVPVAEVRSVSDRPEHIRAALKEAVRYPLVIATGGLGPTNDDRTLSSAAKAFRLPLVTTKASLHHVTSRYQARGLPLTEARLKLALVPRGAQVLENANGTAPGLRLKVKKSEVFFLPGPPTECRPIFEKEVLPLAKRKAAGKRLLRREFWRTFGKGESAVYGEISALVKGLEEEFPETFSFGVHISFPCIDLTLEVWKVKGRKSPPASRIEEAVAEISSRVKEICFTRKREDLVSVVSRELKEKGLTLSTAESCTGGLLGKLLTDQPGSSSFYWGGVVSYDNSAKEALLGVKASTLARAGAVSEATVKEMAEGIRQKLGTDYSLALSGISGPGGGSAEKPVGTIYVALSNGQGSQILHQVILGAKGSRDQNRTIAASLALNLLRNALRE